MGGRGRVPDAEKRVELASHCVDCYKRQRKEGNPHCANVCANEE